MQMKLFNSWPTSKEKKIARDWLDIIWATLYRSAKNGPA